MVLACKLKCENSPVWRWDGAAQMVKITTPKGWYSFRVSKKNEYGTNGEIEENWSRIENKGLPLKRFVPGKQKRNKQARMEKW